jgi:hypothetical protein
MNTVSSNKLRQLLIQAPLLRYIPAVAAVLVFAYLLVPEVILHLHVYSCGSRLPGTLVPEFQQVLGSLATQDTSVWGRLRNIRGGCGKKRVPHRKDQLIGAMATYGFEGTSERYVYESTYIR